MNFDKYLEPPDDIECCEADDCVEPDEEGIVECKCDGHVCSGCDLQCNCRCDADYERYKENQLDY